MSKELREGIQGWVDKRFGVPNTFNTQLLYDFLVYLDEHDVVIKAEGTPCGVTQGRLDTHRGYYGATEPLIKEGE